jgi:hypothetical protein
MEDAGEREESLFTGSRGVPAFGASSLKKKWTRRRGLEAFWRFPTKLEFPHKSSFLTNWIIFLSPHVYSLRHESHRIFWFKINHSIFLYFAATSKSNTWKKQKCAGVHPTLGHFSRHLELRSDATHGGERKFVPIFHITAARQLHARRLACLVRKESLFFAIVEGFPRCYILLIYSPILFII